MDKLKEAAQLAEALVCALEDLSRVRDDDVTEQLYCGLHLLNVYQRLMIAVESDMHPDYRKNIEEFRAKNLR